MKRYSIIFVLFSVCATLMAQGLTLKSSQAATNDPSARTKPRLDLNGKDCALKKAEEKLRITVKGVSFNMIKVKAGSFQMDDDDWAHVVDEHSDTLCHSTVHEFTLTNECYFGETEVTQDLWTAVMGSNPSSFRGPTTGSYTMILNNHWYFVNDDLRVAYRLSFDPSTKDRDIGLRLVLTVPD